MISYWSEKKKIGAEQIIEKLKTGLSGAPISDAGTPGIFDTSSILIKRVIEEGIPITPIPQSIWIHCGIIRFRNANRGIRFLGFLPPKTSDRKKKLKELALESRTMFFMLLSIPA